LEEQTHQADVRDLARFGHPQELRRVLGVYSSFAVAFSYISPSTGIFTLYYLGLGLAGPAFFWSWPLVALGQFIVALNFAEVSSHFPLAGSVYQWTRFLSNRHYSWFTGWIYLFAGIFTVSAVVATVPLVVIPFLNGLGINISSDLNTERNIALLVLISTTLLSIFGVRLVALVNNTGVVFEILGMVVFAVILVIFFHHQDAGVVFNGHPLSATGANAFGVFFAAMFMSLFVIYGFDTASTLAEETKNPRRAAPRAVLTSIAGAFVIGTIFLYATLIAIPGDVDKYVAKVAAGQIPFPPSNIIQSNMPSWAASIYLFVVFAAIYVCCLAIQTATIRLAFGMARDGKLPFGRLYNKVHSTLHVPLGTTILIGVLAAIPFLYFAGAGLLAIVATAMIYLSYLLGNIGILRARLRGWPTEETPFKLGSWGTIVNVLALVWGGSMLINFLWPRDSSVGLQNPPLNQLPNINLPGFLGNLPFIETTIFLVLVIGVIYWAVAQRQAAEAPAIAPAEAQAKAPA
jgi:amino acid transporter